MNNEYWNALLLGKPRIWFYITVVLFIATGVFLMLDWKQGRVVAMPAMFFAFMGWMGWIGPSVPDKDFPEIQKRRRPWFGYMVLLLTIPIISLCLESPPSGPPLNIRIEHRNELLGLRDVDYLIITNKSGEGVVPIAATLKDADRTVPISLPPIFKPNETVEVRVQSTRGRLLIERGDSLTITCKGYGKPLTMKW